MIAHFLSNISAKYCENPTMLSGAIVKNIGDGFFGDKVIMLSVVTQSASGRDRKSDEKNCYAQRYTVASRGTNYV